MADEPLMQLLLDKHLAQGHLPVMGLRGSSIPVPYGAAALWGYAFFRLFTSSFVGVIVLHIAMYSVAILCLWPVLHRRVEGWVVALVLWLALSSPLLFLLTRHPWDNTFQALPAAVLLISVAALDSEKWLRLKLLSIGVASAILLNVHLMPAPVILAAGAVAAFSLCKRFGFQRAAILLLWGLVPFCLVLGPYLVSVVSFQLNEHVVAPPPTGKRWWGDSRNLWWLLQKSLMYLSHWGVKPQLEFVYQDFLGFAGATGALLKADLFGWVPKLAALAALLYVPVRWWKKQETSSLESFLFLSFASLILVFNILNIPTESHYFQPIWWLPFTALAIALHRLSGWKIGFVAGFAVLAALSNSLYTLQLYRFIATNHGVRNSVIGTGYSSQEEAFDWVCKAEKGNEIRLVIYGTKLSPYPMQYFAAKLDSCRGKRIIQTELEQAGWWLHYQGGKDGTNAALEWEKLSAKTGR